jgi:hypothetical protein
MSLQFSEYNQSEENSNKKNSNARGATRKRRCKIGTNKIKNLLNSVEGMGNGESDLADFNPPPNPELTQTKNTATVTPKEESEEGEEKENPQLDNSVQPNDYNNFNHEAANQQYYQQYMPYYTQVGDQQAVNGDKSQLLDKLNYMITILEEQKEHKTDNITEELILYMFLGVFVIFVVDSFARAGKYTR